MSQISAFNECGEEIDNRLRLKSSPLAVKLLATEKDIPEGAIRPKRDWGYCLSTCQSFFTSRSKLGPGISIAMLKEDMWCFEPVIGFGLADAPDYFLEGHSLFPNSANSLEAARNWAQSFPRLEAGKYVGIVSAPLATANFEPDVVIIYCNSSQLRGLIRAAAYDNGNDLTCRISGAAACVYAIVLAMENEECQITVPCLGDRRRAMAQDDELIFSIPKARLQGLLLGLRYLEEHRREPSARPSVMPEYELDESYMTISRMLGMDVDR